MDGQLSPAAEEANRRLYAMRAALAARRAGSDLSSHSDPLVPLPEMGGWFRAMQRPAQPAQAATPASVMVAGGDAPASGAVTGLSLIHI